MTYNRYDGTAIWRCIDCGHDFPTEEAVKRHQVPDSTPEPPSLSSPPPTIEPSPEPTSLPPVVSPPNVQPPKSSVDGGETSVTMVQGSALHCTNCGIQIAVETKFCAGCGMVVGAPVTQSVALQPIIREPEASKPTKCIHGWYGDYAPCQECGWFRGTSLTRRMEALKAAEDKEVWKLSQYPNELEALERSGHIKKVGWFNKHYELTEKGWAVIKHSGRFK